MDTNANNNRESFEDQQVIFVDTHLIQKAVEGLQRAREEFQTLLEQAEGGDASVYYDLGVRYTEGDGTDKDPAQAARWFALASEDGDLRPPTCWALLPVRRRGGEGRGPGPRSSFSRRRSRTTPPPSATWA